MCVAVVQLKIGILATPICEEEDKVTYEYFQSIIDGDSEIGVYSIAYNGGEPLLHNDIEKIIAYSNKK